MRVAVIVPWRDGCPHRRRAWDWIRARYAREHPDWTLVEARAPAGAWCKAAAVMPAIAATAADIVIVADADCWTTGLTDAVEEVAAGAGWAIPHLLVHRLTDDATSGLLAGGLPAECEEAPYPGVEGGGFVIAAREVLTTVPLDPRFVGWGQEDKSWAFALYAMLGEPWRGTADLIHLWHPPQQRLTRTRGSMDGWRLRTRYAKARADPTVMRALLEEAHAALNALEPAVHDHAEHSVE